MLFFSLDQLPVPHIWLAYYYIHCNFSHQTVMFDINCNTINQCMVNHITIRVDLLEIKPCIHVTVKSVKSVKRQDL